MKSKLFLCVLAMLLCGSTVSFADVFILPRNVRAQKPVHGQINGVAWAMVTGRAQIRDGQLRASLWSSEYADVCNETFGSEFNVRFQAPAKEGVHPVSRNGATPVVIMSDMRKYGPENNIIAQTGQIEITVLAPGQVRGRLVNIVGPLNSRVLGEFALTICP